MDKRCESKDGSFERGQVRQCPCGRVRLQTGQEEETSKGAEDTGGFAEDGPSQAGFPKFGNK